MVYEVRKSGPKQYKRIDPGTYDAVITDVILGETVYGDTKVPNVKFIFNIIDQRVTDDRLRKFVSKSSYQGDQFGVYLDPDKRLYGWLYGLYAGDVNRIANGDVRNDLIGTRCKITIIADGENRWMESVVASNAGASYTPPPVQKPQAPFQKSQAPAQKPQPAPYKATQNYQQVPSQKTGAQQPQQPPKAVEPYPHPQQAAPKKPAANELIGDGAQDDIMALLENTDVNFEGLK